MTTTLEEAKKENAREFIRSVRDNDSYTPCEADGDLNDSSREVIAAMAREHGQVWLGNVNLYGKDRTTEKGGEGSNPMWLWDGSLVCNFGAGFVIPCDDEVLRQLILERDRAPYTGTKEDYDRVEAIHDRIEFLGGTNLVWS